MSLFSGKNHSMSFCSSNVVEKTWAADDSWLFYPSFISVLHSLIRTWHPLDHCLDHHCPHPFMKISAILQFYIKSWVGYLHCFLGQLILWDTFFVSLSWYCSLLWKDFWILPHLPCLHVHMLHLLWVQKLFLDLLCDGSMTARD